MRLRDGRRVRASPSAGGPSCRRSVGPRAYRAGFLVDRQADLAADGMVSRRLHRGSQCSRRRCRRPRHQVRRRRPVRGGAGRHRPRPPGDRGLHAGCRSAAGLGAAGRAARTAVPAVRGPDRQRRSSAAAHSAAGSDPSLESVRLARVGVRRCERGPGRGRPPGPRFPHLDRRWPTSCSAQCSFSCCTGPCWRRSPPNASARPPSASCSSPAYRCRCSRYFRKFTPPAS